MRKKEISQMKSTKKEKQREHGIGFLNIREAVQKYNGVLKTGVENEVFEVSILLPLPEMTKNRPFDTGN